VQQAGNWAKRNQTPLAVGGAALAGGAGLYGLYKSYQAQKQREEDERMRRRMMFKGASDTFIQGVMDKMAQAKQLKLTPAKGQGPTVKLPPVTKKPITQKKPDKAV